MANTQQQAVEFYFDVSCPWAWRTSLWIREVEKVRPIQVTWKFLSLAKINEAGDYSRDSHTASHATFPLLARARERGGNDVLIASILPSVRPATNARNRSPMSR